VKHLYLSEDEILSYRPIEALYSVAFRCSVTSQNPLNLCIIQMMGGGVIPSTQRYYRNYYIFWSYDHLQEEIYLLGFTRLTMDPLFLE
jgi:hypothetical protein